MFKIFCIAVALFVSTNIDDVFVLLGFFADRRFRASEVITGQYLGIFALVGVSILASLLSFSLPHAYMGLLGLIVVALGMRRTIRLFTEPASPEPDRHERVGRHRHSRVVTVALVTLANGGDNIVVYTPAFAVRSSGELAAIAIVFALMTAIWCLAAILAVNHPRVRTPIRRYGRVVSPLVFLAIGVMVMVEAGTLKLIFR